MQRTLIVSGWITAFISLSACQKVERDFDTKDSGTTVNTVTGFGALDGGTPSTAVAPQKADNVPAGSGQTDADATVGVAMTTAPVTADNHSSNVEPTDTEPTDTDVTDTDQSAPAPTDDSTSTEDASSAPPEEPTISCSDDTECNDANPCNGQELCQEGSCQAGTRAADGSLCDTNDGESRLCRNGNCVISRCGDGFVDERWNEQCDDANSENGDGCDLGCVFSCASADDCDDGVACNGTESCSEDSHTCVSGEPLPDDASCGSELICNAGRCVSLLCGDGVVSEDEACDDGNLIDGDGCDSNCEPSCTSDVECDDGNVCNGEETCDLATNTCTAGNPLTCNDDNNCTSDSCAPTMGCLHALIDEDNDGESPSELGDCGTDCDDNNNTIYSTAAELCDMLDNNCNGQTDESAPTWFLDCDGDGFAPASAESIKQCDKPGVPRNCTLGSAGDWTTQAPKSQATTDCWDDNQDVYPAPRGIDFPWSSAAIERRDKQVDFDYNCDNEEEPRWTTTRTVDARCSILSIVPDAPLLEPALAPIKPSAISCTGSAGWSGESVPECGDPAAWSACAVVDGDCKREATKQVQECR